MNLAASPPYLTVLEEFQRFYVEIIDLKRSAHSPAALPEPGIVDELIEGGRPAAIWRKAAEILDGQTRQAIHASPVEARLHREARFVMAALADEVFIHPRWEGTDYWLSHLLESRYFRTHSAGEVFFDKASALLTVNDPAADQLVLVYLMALALGFRGKYAGRPDGDAAIRDLRVRLLETIWRKHPGMLNEAGHLFPHAGRSTVREGPIRKLPSPSKWVTVALAVVVFWVLFSWIPWKALSGPLYDKLPDDSTANTSANKPDTGPGRKKNTAPPNGGK